MTDIDPLLKLMEKLRDKDKGCPWDIKQDHNSIAHCSIEEAYELVAAITKNDQENIKEELGDILLQVIFHSQIAKENNACLLYTSPSPRDKRQSRMPSSA